MARQSSKIMSIAEKKVAQAGLKTALQNHNASVRAIDVTLNEAAKVMGAAKRLADATIAKLNKEQAVVAKAVEKDVKAAQKVYDAAVAKHAKLKAAADKGTEKLTAQAEALEAAPAGPTPGALVTLTKAGKVVKARAEELVEA